MKTSTAEKHSYICPVCGDKLTQDSSGKGFVRHISNRKCEFEKGQKDAPGAALTSGLSPVAPEPFKLLNRVTVCGYSERGMFNALLHEISYSESANELLMELLGLVRTPRGAVEHSSIEGALLLLEPSLSDFGDADAVALVCGAGRRCAVFIEGKVKSSQAGSWTVRKEWMKFAAGVQGELDSSNLFTQLYHKVRFASALRAGGIVGLQRGIAFPACSPKPVRRIGDNPVVLMATQLISEYLDRVQYVAVVPDSPQRVEEFFRNELLTLSPSDLPGWDTSGWGHLCWLEVEEFCRRNGLVNSVRLFEFNRGQIY